MVHPGASTGATVHLLSLLLIISQEQVGSFAQDVTHRHVVLVQH